MKCLNLIFPRTPNKFCWHHNSLSSSSNASISRYERFKWKWWKIKSQNFTFISYDWFKSCSSKISTEIRIICLFNASLINIRFIKMLLSFWRSNNIFSNGFVVFFIFDNFSKHSLKFHSQSKWNRNAYLLKFFLEILTPFSLTLP